MASPPGSAAGFACKYENFEEWRTGREYDGHLDHWEISIQVSR